MEYLYAGQRGRNFHALYLRTFFIRAGITAGRHDNSERRLVAPAQIDMFKFAITRGQQRGCEIGFEAHHQHLTLGIPEAAIIFDKLRLAVLDHQPRIKNAHIGRSAFGHRPDSWPHNARKRLFSYFRREQCGRADRAHPAGIGTRVAIIGAFVILGARKRQHMLAIGQNKETCLFAFEKFLDDDFIIGRRQHSPDGSLRCRPFVGHNNAFAGGKAVHLDDDALTQCSRECDSRLGFAESPIGGGRNVVCCTEILDVALRALELRSLCARTQSADAGSFEPIPQPCNKRCFGSDHDKVDCLFPCKGNQRVRIVYGHRNAFRDVRDAGVSRRAIELVDERARRKRPGQRMFPSARSDEKEFHGWLTIDPAWSET